MYHCGSQPSVHSQGILRKLLREQGTRSVIGRNLHCLPLLDFVRPPRATLKYVCAHTHSLSPTIIQPSQCLLPRTLSISWLRLSSQNNSKSSRIPPCHGRFPFTTVSTGYLRVLCDDQGTHTCIFSSGRRTHISVRSAWSRTGGYDSATTTARVGGRIHTIIRSTVL